MKFPVIWTPAFAGVMYLQQRSVDQCGPTRKMRVWTIRLGNGLSDFGYLINLAISARISAASSSPDQPCQILTILPLLSIKTLRGIDLA